MPLLISPWNNFPDTQSTTFCSWPLFVFFSSVLDPSRPPMERMEQGFNGPMVPQSSITHFFIATETCCTYVHVARIVGVLQRLPLAKSLFQPRSLFLIKLTTNFWNTLRLLGAPFLRLSVSSFRKQTRQGTHSY